MISNKDADILCLVNETTDATVLELVRLIQQEPALVSYSNSIAQW